MLSYVPGQHLHLFDLVLIAVYLAAITLFGLRFRARKGGKSSLESYFLADRTVPWWAIALSIVSAETSTLTIISIPSVAFAGDFGFMQVVFGYMTGRIVVAALFLPKYFQGQMLTAYQLIDRRFGRALHQVTAGLFLVTRAAAEGVRVFAVSIVVSIAIGTGNVASIAVVSALTLIYTFEGGMTAVIWTDVVQMAIYVGGTLIAIATLGTHVPGGWMHIHAVAAAAGKFHLFNFALNLTQTYTFWAGLIGGTFLTMASHGTDQLIVQRLLAARNLRQSRASLLSSGVVILVQFALFLLIGAGLYVFYGLHPGTSFRTNDYIFPTFIVREMPVGIAGLLIAAILAAAMSNLSAALNSLSSTTVVDFYMRLRPRADDRERMLISRSSTVLWALVLFAIAVYSISAGGKGHVVEIGLSIASVAYGALLGVFLLGTLTRYATQTGAILGMVAGFATNLVLWRFPGRILFSTISVPNIAWTWYVLIGALVTFVVGSIASFILRKQTTRKPTAVTAALIALIILSAAANPIAHRSLLAQEPVRPAPTQAAAPDFTPISALMNDAIAAKKLPGAVVVVGHNGRIVFEQAYGNRALEPAVEPMTEDTIFDMASLTKCLATATAMMQLYDQGKYQFDDPVAKYLPEFAVNGKDKVTIRELLTHYSGLPPDVDLKTAWTGKQTGLNLAFQSKLDTTPGTVFRYSDINFITLGALVEKLSGEPLDEYAWKHIYQPLGMMHTRYLPPSSWIPQIAPTAHNDDGPLADNKLLRGTVHDPTARRMGGVAGHAGVFSTAQDVLIYAQALLDKLLHNTGPFPVSQSTLRLMTSSQQPATARADATIFAADGQLTKGVAVRGFGWDINTAYARPRGDIFPIGSFGHTGFTGTTLWIDPASDSYVILLANAIHPSGSSNITTLRGEVSTAAARAIQQYQRSQLKQRLNEDADVLSNPVRTGIDVLVSTHYSDLAAVAHRHENRLRLGLLTNQSGLDSQGRRTIDLLATEASKAVPGLVLTTLFSPEHGIFGRQDTTSITAEVDPTTHLPVVSLYGAKDSDRHPSHEQLKELDAVVIDLQDAGVRFYTYETVLGYFLEASAEERKLGHSLEIIVLDRPNIIGGEKVQGPVSDAGHDSYTNYMPLPIRHGLTLGELARYINGERRFPSSVSDNIHVPLQAQLTVIPMQDWKRTMYFDDTRLPWTPPSPNLHSITAAVLYPGVALLETTNVSVGRGTERPFEQFGAPWINAPALTDYLTRRKIAGVSFAASAFSVAEDANRYLYHGQTIPAVRITVTDRNALDSPELGIELLSALNTLYPQQFELSKANRLLVSVNTMLALENREDPRQISASWQMELDAFKQRREPYLIYSDGSK